MVPHAAVAAARGSVPDEPGFVRLFTEGPRGAKRARKRAGFEAAKKREWEKVEVNAALHGAVLCF